MKPKSNHSKRQQSRFNANFQMIRVLKSVLNFWSGSSVSLVAIEKTTGASLPYYFSAIIYVYCAMFLLYLIWALMLYLEESIFNDSTTYSEGGDWFHLIFFVINSFSKFNFDLKSCVVLKQFQLNFSQNSNFYQKMTFCLL